MQVAGGRAVIVRPHKRNRRFEGLPVRLNQAPNPPGQPIQVGPVKALAVTRVVPPRAEAAVWAGLAVCSEGLADRAVRADPVVQAGLAV